MRFSRSIAAGLLALAAVPAHATVVDIAAANPDDTTMWFAAGHYKMAVVGTSDGGAYDGYSIASHLYAWDDPRSNVPCLNGRSQCRDGYQSQFVTTIDGESTLYRLASDLVTPVPGYFRYTTLASAIAAARAGPFTSALDFVLRAATTVRFRVDDSSWWDDDGGVSLSVALVPEPAAWTMMIAGFGLIGAAARTRRRTVVTA